MKEYAILLDTTSCTGCNSCSYRCIQEFGDHEPAARGLFRTVAELKDDGIYHQQCMHCKDPQCAKASPAGAFTKTAYGAVLYDAEKTQGDKQGAAACPFHGVQYDEKTNNVLKCTMCAHRVSAGKEPACVDACPAGALQFGEYGAIVDQAKRAALNRKLKIYGLKENGGTHFIVLTKVDPALLGYPKVAHRKMTALNTVDLSVPLAAGVVYAGFKKLTDRRAAVDAEEKEKPK
jgi:formate dehydrogenase iron-sulfur subunit